MSTPEPTTVATVRDAAVSLVTQELQVDLIPAAAATTSRGAGTMALHANLRGPCRKKSIWMLEWQSRNLHYQMHDPRLLN